MGTPNVLLSVARKVGHTLHKAVKMLSIVNTILHVLGSPHMPSDILDKANAVKTAVEQLQAAIQAFIDPPDLNVLAKSATTTPAGHAQATISAPNKSGLAIRPHRQPQRP